MQGRKNPGVASSRAPRDELDARLPSIPSCSPSSLERRPASSGDEPPTDRHTHGNPRRHGTRGHPPLLVADSRDNSPSKTWRVPAPRVQSSPTRYSPSCEIDPPPSPFEPSFPCFPPRERVAIARANRSCTHPRRGRRATRRGAWGQRGRAARCRAGAPCCRWLSPSHSSHCCGG